MANIRTFADTSAGYIADELDYDPNKRETVRFGLEIVFGSAIKGVLMILISYVLGIMPYVFAVLVTSIILRLLSGGTHLHTYIRCLTFSTVMTIGISYAALAAAPFLDRTSMLFVITIAALLGFCFINNWAPADSPGKPIKSEGKRAIYRRLSRLFVISWSAILIFIVARTGQSPLPITLCLASVGGFLWQVISIAPFSYRLAGRADRWLDHAPANGGE